MECFQAGALGALRLAAIIIVASIGKLDADYKYSEANFRERTPWRFGRKLEYSL